MNFSFINTETLEFQRVKILVVLRMRIPTNKLTDVYRLRDVSFSSKHFIQIVCFSQKKILPLQKELVLRKLKGYVDVAHSVDLVGLFFCLFDKDVSLKLL